MKDYFANRNENKNEIQKIEQIRKKIANADAAIIGAGVGLSAAAGFIFREKIHGEF